MDKIDLTPTNRLISLGTKDIACLIGLWSIIIYTRLDNPNFNIFEIYLPLRRKYYTISHNNVLFGLGLFTNLLVINRYLGKSDLPQFHHLNFWLLKPLNK